MFLFLFKSIWSSFTSCPFIPKDRGLVNVGVLAKREYGRDSMSTKEKMIRLREVVYPPPAVCVSVYCIVRCGFGGGGHEICGYICL